LLTPLSLTWLALEPLTGRTHQLRVHCAAMQWPIVGDNIYGNAPRTGGPRLQLHARDVSVPLYKNREPIRVTAPVPAHMMDMLKACGWSGEDVGVAAAPALNRPHAEERA
jgi:tRNA pseudouridine32 synthase/23S rRNA pseudouridine746 synthase